MFNFNYWRCKHLAKRIESLEQSREKFTGYIQRTTLWIKQNKEELNSALKELSNEEFVKLGQELGYLDDADSFFIKEMQKRDIKI